MKKLLIGLGAASLALGAVADKGYITKSCDLSTYAYSSANDFWGVLSQEGDHKDFTLSSDMNRPFEFFVTWTYSTPGTSSSATFDFKGHTLMPISSLTPTFYLRASTSGEDPYALPDAYLTLKNGTILGSGSGDTFGINGDWDKSGVKGHVVLENMVITNFAGMSYGTEMADSEILFKDCSLTIGYMAPFQHSHNGESNLTITYQDTVINTDGDIGTDTALASEMGDYLSSDLNHKIVYTGPKTVATTTSAHAFLFGTGVPYFKSEVLNGAKLVTPNGFYIGFNGNSHDSTLLVDNATLQGDFMWVGHQSGRQTVVINEADIQLKNLSVGWHTDNNTVIISNSNLSTFNWISVGGWGVADYAPKNSKLYICGQKTTLPAGKFPYTFTGANGLLAFDNVTLDAPSYGISYCPINPGGSVDLAWENNELSFVNGAQVTLGDCFMGNPWEPTLQCRNQKLSVKDEAKFSVKAMIVAGVNNTVIISNATLEARSENLLWCGNDCQETVSSENNKIVFQGDHPKLTGTYKESWTRFDHKSTLEFVLPEDGNYREPPIQAERVTCISGFTSAEDNYINFSFPNVKEFQQSLVGTKDIELMRCAVSLAMVSQTTAANEQELIDYINSTLPEGCSIYRTGDYWGAGSIFLRVKGGATAKPGAVLLIK